MFKRLRILTIVVLLMIAYKTTLVLAANQFEMHVLDVGQGQCTIFGAEGHYMIFDGGGRGSSSFVVSYLQQMGIETVDVVAVSHYEEDHMSGIIGVLSAFSCKRLLLPPYEGTGELYQSLATAALSNGCEIIHPRVGDNYSFGGADLKVLGPQKPDYPADNDMSLCLKVTYGEKGFLVCGDAQQASEMDLVNSGENLKADVYVADHHGSSTSSMDAFLDCISPQFAIISCGKDNGYGHPSMETLQRLKNHGISLFRTDQQGTIVAYSDGSDIWFNMEPSDNWAAGNNVISLDRLGDDTDDFAMSRVWPTEENPEKTQDETEESFQYVCNTNTKKFHAPRCNSVKQMKEENRLYTNLNREELLAEGYEPCGNCKP